MQFILFYLFFAIYYFQENYMYPIEDFEKGDVVSNWIIKSLLCFNFLMRNILDEEKQGFVQLKFGYPLKIIKE